MISAQNYITRRANFAKLAKQTLLIISGNDHIQQSSDETYEFAQDGYFYYLTGIFESGWRLVIDQKNGLQFLFNVDPSGYHDEVWEDRLSQQKVTKISGIAEIKSEAQAWAYIKAKGSVFKSVGTLTYKHRFNRDFGMFINPAKVALTDRLKKSIKGLKLVDISSEIRKLRTIKDEQEIANIEAALKISKIGFDVVSSKINSYQTEAEINADFDQAFIASDSDFAYAPIIASGANAAKLHYIANSSPVPSDSLILCDVAASYGHYKADVTRTFQFGKPNPRKIAVNEAVLDIQAKSFNYLKAGVKMREHELYVEKLVGVALNDLGVIKSSKREDIRKYYPHGVSHHLGIDVHDSCDYEAPLPVGAVITVEPGIYLPEEGIGVRIEDDVVITKKGIEILSKDIAK